MADPWRIVGSLLVRDDDLYVEQAVRNVFGFCDELILVDHRSRDRTPQILERVAAESPIPASVHRIRDAGESQDLIKDFAGKHVWLFGLDGDEIYDPGGLLRLRERLVRGEMSEHWQIRGNVIHCIALDVRAGTAIGHPSPPAPSISKLYNFSRIETWEGPCPQRLDGLAGLRFRADAVHDKYELNKTVAWEESPFRCLHLCFVRRSSLQRSGEARLNVSDRTQPRRFPLRWWRAAREAADFAPRSQYKEHYRVGELVTVATAPFFS